MSPEAEEKLLKAFDKQLDEGWRREVESMNVEQLKEALGTIAKNEEVNQGQKSEDLNLAQAKEEFDRLGARYKEASKANYWKSRFAARELKAKGG